jgi:hypothetical protein
MSRYGKRTGTIGKYFYNSLSNYEVFYDHGDKINDPNVVAIQGFLGVKPSNKTNLAEIDILIAEDNHAKILRARAQCKPEEN